MIVRVGVRVIDSPFAGTRSMRTTVWSTAFSEIV